MIQMFLPTRQLTVARHKSRSEPQVKSTFYILIHVQCTPYQSYAMVMTGWNRGQSNAARSPHWLLAAVARCGVVVGGKAREDGVFLHWLDLHTLTRLQFILSWMQYPEFWPQGELPYFFAWLIHQSFPWCSIYYTVQCNVNLNIFHLVLKFTSTL